MGVLHASVGLERAPGLRRLSCGFGLEPGSLSPIKEELSAFADAKLCRQKVAYQS